MSNRNQHLAKNRFANLDLNLLRVFKVLYEDKNMRRASERLFVSQPAVSQSLQKLRYHFDDPLFVKIKSGLAPTSYADQLAKKLIPFLYGLEEAINEVDDFDPHQLDSEITIALASTFVYSLSGKVFRYFQEKAPNLKVNIASWNDKTLEELEKGSVFFGINAGVVEGNSTLASTNITNVYTNVLVRHDHPLVGKSVDLDMLAQYPFARLLVSDYSKHLSPTIDVFRKHGFELEIGFSSEYPVTLIDVVKHSDMFMATTDCFPIEDHPKLALIKPDERNIEYTFEANGYYHKRHKNSQLMNWLVASFQDIFANSKSNR
ncbi:LysR family transcriptional regulator [Vibrio mediterranei]|uniref:LysR substrate-binding domain-containing protein n=1 Tax=Vibrio mediterranei TaxID=689 RepID=UPI0022842A13|nr:LysR family transcriptional regulator [Vibrio mediterranei]MCY9852452.1 LysR family transcriptional regulator [Vibrio mediterranei]